MNEDTFEVPEGAEYRYLVQEEDNEEVQYVRRRTYVSPLLVLSKGCITLMGMTVLSLLGLATYLAYVSQTLPRGLARVTTDGGAFQGRHVSLLSCVVDGWGQRGCVVLMLHSLIWFYSLFLNQYK